LGRKFLLAFVSLIAGLMVAVLFQSNQKTEARDTRDLWEIRTELKNEQIRTQKLYQQIRETKEILSQYEEESDEEILKTLVESVDDLKEKVGLTEKSGPGIIITLKPIYLDLKMGQAYPTIPPDLINRLLNELKIYGATDIAIENERIINISPVREVGDYTYINNRPVPPLPIEIKAIANDVQKLLDYMEVSVVNDYFAIENIEVVYRQEDNITLPKYDQIIDYSWFNMESQETGES
jgi:uncharacterized protein YlxW (UPF0749 family)